MNDPRKSLSENLRWLCDEARMLTGMSVAYGTPSEAETALYGRAQEAECESGALSPRVRPLAADSLFDLASLTKLFVSVCAMRLIELGKLSLSERVGEIDRRFAHLREAAVGDVLGFTVSLQTDGRVDAAPDREEGLRRLFATHPVEAPAVRVYSDVNAMVVKYVIEAKAGMPLSDALRAFVFTPAGLADTFAVVPPEARNRCVCYGGEHRVEGERHILRADVPLGAPHDPKALLLSQGGRDLCGHAGLFSTRADMTRFSQALLSGAVISPASLAQIGKNRTGFPYGDGTHRQYLGYLCFAKHPDQHFSEVPAWMGEGSIGLSGFTGNHLSLNVEKKRFVLFLGNRCHMRVSRVVPPPGKTLADYGLDARGVGLVPWPDGRLVPSSAQYVYFKDERLHAPIERRMRALGWI